MSRDRDDGRQQPLARRAAPSLRDLALPEAPVGRDGIGELQRALADLGTRAHLLGAASTTISAPPPDHVVQLRVAVFDSTIEGEGATSNGRWYKVTGGKLALHRAALEQLASAAGISDVSAGCSVRLLEPYHWHATHTVELLTLEGQTRRIARDVEIDLRDGSPEASSYKTDRDLLQARKFGLRAAQSKAANRAIRAALGLQGGYTAEEARKPFVFPCLVYVPPQTPEIQRIVAMQRLGVAHLLYGPSAAPTPPAPAMILDVDVDDRDDDEVPDDYDADAAEAQRKAPPAKSSSTTSSTAARLVCSKCKAEINTPQHTLTLDLFGVALCRVHAREQ